MNLTEVRKSLEQQFGRALVQGSRRNIVFWYDDEGIFADSVDSLSFDDVKIIKLYDNNMFAVKLYIEETDRESHLLVYSPLPRPDNRENWLADTILYSQTFSTDETSLNLLNFKIDSALRGVVAKYKLFFRNTERNKRFESYNLAPYSEPKIDLAVLSALCKLPAPNLDDAVRTLLVEMSSGKSTVYDSIRKYGNMDTFWTLMHRFYGYNFEEQSLEKLAILLLVSHFSHGINGNIPNAWQPFVSDNPNCYIFADNFMKDRKSIEDYNALADFAAGKLGLSEQIEKWTIDEIAACDTFTAFDHSIVRRITTNITQNAGEYGHYRKILNSRKNRRNFQWFETEIQLLLHACEYLELTVTYETLPGESAAQLFENYTKTLYKLDNSYRHFILTYDKLDDDSDYKNLYDMVENSYTNRHLNELAVKWCSFWDDALLRQLPGVPSRQSFYDTYVHRFVHENERIIVIISGGLRYESAVELNNILNREQKGSCELVAMLGDIPSHTALGPASLLPHKHLVTTGKAECEIDGISAKSIENRCKILQLVKKESVAVQYEDIVHNIKALIGMKLIYIYHNTIDARRDNAPTENEIFVATNKAFGELSALVRKLRNDISAINILITSDGGYILRRAAPGNQPLDGRTLQEEVIPVIHFKSDKNLARPMRAKKVSLGLTDLSRRITSFVTHLTFFQNEPVDEKHLPLRMTSYFVDETGNRISNENIITAESKSRQPEARTYKEKYTLKNMAYDRDNRYYLICKDADETMNAEMERIPFVIDLFTEACV